MNNKVFYGLMGLLTVGMIALAFVWPQGLGSRSPAPFGHDVVEPDYVRMQREKETRDARRKVDQAAKAEIKARERAEREAAAKEAGNQNDMPAR
jgi:hypothetical protein